MDCETLRKYNNLKSTWFLMHEKITPRVKYSGVMGGLVDGEFSTHCVARTASWEVSAARQ